MKKITHVIDTPEDCPHRKKFVCTETKHIFHLCLWGVSDFSVMRCSNYDEDGKIIFPEDCPLDNQED